MNSNTKLILDNFPYDSTQIDVSNKNITGILDLSNFINLIELDCSNNQITQILNINNQLQILNCSNNLITHITFDYDYFQSKNIPVTNKFKRRMNRIIFCPPELVKLDCANNQICNMICISGNIKCFDCANNLLKRIIVLDEEPFEDLFVKTPYFQ